MEGDSVSPDSLSTSSHSTSWPSTRFRSAAAPAEPPADRHHQRRQMELLYDMPLPLGEPHYVVAIKADKLKPVVRYKSGWDSRADKSVRSTRPAQDVKTERSCDANGNCTTEVWGTVIQLAYHARDHRGAGRRHGQDPPDQPRACWGRVHGFAMYGQNVRHRSGRARPASASFVADQEGVFPYYCTEFCSACTWRCRVTCSSPAEGLPGQGPRA